MHAITVVPRQQGTARLDDIAEPPAQEGAILVEAVAVGVCGTDHEILSGDYGWSPPGRERLVVGHESLARVIEAPSSSEVRAGDLIVPIVRVPDPVPCESCAAGEWDMCRNGSYTEHGIKALDGFARERFRVAPPFLVRVDPALGVHGVLLEPTSVVAKAWEQIRRIGSRSHWRPRRALVLGAGPVGLLAAMIGVQQKLEVHVLDRVTSGPKPDLVKALGATYHTGKAADVKDVDVVIEATGAASLVFDAMRCVVPDGIVCLTGVAAGHGTVDVDAAALNNQLVLGNNVVVGSVSANQRHFSAGAAALAAADPAWLDGLITRQMDLARWREAYQPAAGDIKTILRFS